MAKKTIRVAINGFGRIGRAAFKIAQKHKDIEIVAINDLVDTDTLAHLLQYDSVYGKFQTEVKAGKDCLIVGKKTVSVLAIKDPKTLPWKKLKIDVVLECTGFFVDDTAAAHIVAGAKKVIISAPAKSASGAIQTLVKGVNTDNVGKIKGNVFSNASCTTNCISPVVEVIHSNFGIKKAILSTIHAYTADQRLIDAPHKDKRRARAAAVNIIPTSTGAAIATTETIPSLKGLFDGLALRVPVITGSLSDITFVLDKKVTEKQVNDVLIKASLSKRYKGVIECSNAPLVSTDIIGNPHSSIVDLELTKVIDGDLLKLIVWYDNEWGYSNRLIEMAKIVS